MLTSNRLASAFGLVASFALATASQAAIIVGNLGANLDTGSPTSSTLYYDVPSNFQNNKGMAFTPSSAYTVGTLTLKLRDQNATPNTISQVNAAIYAATASAPFLAGGPPPTALVTFTPTLAGTTPIAAGTSAPNTGTNYTFSPNQTFDLAAGTAYYLVVTAFANNTSNTTAAGHAFQWLATKATTADAGSNGTLGTPRFGDGGTTPNLNGGTTPNLNGGTSSNYTVFQLESAVPEPASASVILVAAGLGLARRRR